MKPKNLLILCVMAVVLAGLAYWSSSNRNKPSETYALIGKPALPTLQDYESINRIAKVIVQSATSTLTAMKMDEGWIVPEKYNYPVEFDQIRNLVNALIDLKIDHVVPPNEKLMKSLALMPPASGAPDPSSGTMVKLQDKNGTDIAAFVMGKEHKASASPNPAMAGLGGYADGRFIAVDGKGYLITKSLSVMPEQATDLFETKLLSVYASDVMEISITDSKNGKLTLKRPKNGEDFQVAKLGADEEMNTSKVNSLSGILSYITFVDVADPSLPAADMGLDKPSTVVARTKDGKTYTLKVGGSPKDSTDKYINLSAVFEPPPEELDKEEKKPEEKKKDEKEKSEEEKKKEEEAAEKKKVEEAKKKKEAQDKLAAEVKEFNDTIGKWTYLLEAQKVADLTTDRKELVQKKEKKDDDNKDKK